MIKSHRGPFSLAITRHVKGKPASQWLGREIDTEEVEEEALSLLTDPRDTIAQVHVWSEREHQFVHCFRRER